MSVPYLARSSSSGKYQLIISPELDVRVEVDELLKVVLRDLLPEVELSGLPEDRQ